MFNLILLKAPNSGWCCFRTLPSAAVAAEVSANCLFSLATLEVSFRSRCLDFALTEQEGTQIWRWAIVTPEGSILHEGREPTQAEAKHTAEDALRLAAA